MDSAVVNKPLVSVLMTAYNREKYIGEAIESVLSSTYENLELIIVDDRSKDGTVEIARSYASRDVRVKVFVNEKNLGDYPNRNQAASHASGKYLKYVDADDYIYPWGINVMVNMMELFPDCGWGICSLDQLETRPFPIKLEPSEIYRHHYFINGLFHRAPLSVILTKKAFDFVGGFKEIRMAGDFEMWHRLGKNFSAVLMPKGIVWYRKHAQQEMSDYLKYLPVYEQIKVQYLKDSKCPLEESVRMEILKKDRNRYLLQFLKDIVRFKFKMLHFYTVAYKQKF